MRVDRITRRTALKLTGLSTIMVRGWRPLSTQAAATPLPLGYGTDPDLLRRTVTWPRTLTPSQLATLEALSDIVLPAEPPHPSGSAVRVHDFLDEWLSAPYPQTQADRAIILQGLRVLDEVMHEEANLPFEKAAAAKQSEVFSRICSAHDPLIPFAHRLIELICAGYYTTREGHTAIGYIGNVALSSFPGPPSEVLLHLQQALEELLRNATSTVT